MRSLSPERIYPERSFMADWIATERDRQISSRMQPSEEAPKRRPKS